MKKLTLKDVARATFWNGMKLSGSCCYCNEIIDSRAPKEMSGALWVTPGTMEHLSRNHPDIAYFKDGVSKK